MNTYTYAHTQMHTHAYTQHMHTHVHTCLVLRTCAHSRMCTHVHAHMHAHTHTHTHNGIYSAIKKHEIMPFAAAQIDLESLVLSEGSQTEKYDLPYMWTLKRNYTNEILQNRKRLTDLENEPMVAGEEGIVREFRMDMHTRLYLKWITNKDLL